MGHFNRRRLIAGAAASGLLFTRAVHADTPALPSELDADFAAVLRDGDLPSGALAIVKDGEIVAAKGYGVRERGRLASEMGLEKTDGAAFRTELGRPVTTTATSAAKLLNTGHP